MIIIPCQTGWNCNWIYITIIQVILVTKGLQRQASGRGKVTKQDNRLLYVITKYLLLVSLSNFSTLLLLVWWITEVSFAQYLPQIAFLFTSCDNFVNSLSLHLQFAFGNVWYEKLCHVCHQCIKQQMIKRTIPAAMMSQEIDKGTIDLTLTTTNATTSIGNDDTKLDIPSHQAVYSESPREEQVDSNPVST